MHLETRKITKDYAVEILHWKYEKPYDLYNNELNTESIDEMLNNTYFAIVDRDDDLIGYYCTGSATQVPAGNKIKAYDENYIDIGIGMKPNLTGKGFGSTFFSFILKDIQEAHLNTPMRLTVATFNKRAIRLYEKFGFVGQIKFNTDVTEFITMIRHETRNKDI
ncbi:GNAT family N-acetyltransferase [Virgibacillus phasianinus]|uniref:GNAT family N-acetyltransferase n=1 Tax=Virgibacillus phasianinus TaxID=2017483 RepID=A0A220TYY0_9BACI|nr:GNAT family N-acetyltransferase [Virgibacillus phasianinus]ASK61007.1 GNAT family N-acetyltransferase [Virgibacillus phasianinus]